MKKNVIMLALAAFMVFSTVECMAADAVYRPDANGSYTLSYEDEKIVDGESYGFVVVEGLDNEILDLSDDNFDSILYIDEAVAADGSVSFSSFGLRGTQPTEEGFVGGTAFIGGEGFDSATTVGTLEAPDVAVTSVTLDKTEVALDVGGTVTLAATVAPDNATDKTVTWTSSDSAVASVDANGVVKGETASETPVTITATAGDKSATCTVTVTAPATGEGDEDKVAGDIDGDGEITISDPFLICRKMAGHNVDVSLDVADVDGDGEITISDPFLICRKMAGHNVTLQ